MAIQKILIAFLLILLLLTGCGLETKTLPEFYEKELDDVTKIQILDGSTGAKKVIHDKEVIDVFLSEIKDIKFIPEENQEDRSGFRYGIVLYQDDENAFSFSLNEINDNYFYTQPDIHPIVEDFYKNLEVIEE